MSIIIVTQRLALVRETSHRYDLNRNIGGPEDAAKAFNTVLHLDESPQEIFAALYTSTKMDIVGMQVLTMGCINKSLAEPAEVFKAALLYNASSVILAHNHPSGDPEPSKEDIEATMRIVKAGEILGIPVDDHIIIGNGRYVSLCERGNL